VAAAAVAVALFVAPLREARAWTEVHVEADDVKLSVERTGEARVEHRITVRIAGSPLRSLDIRGVDADATPDPEGFVVPQKDAARGSLASAVQTTAERMPLDGRPRPDGSPAPTVLRVRFDKERGLARGLYVLTVRYATHLAPVVEPGGGPLARLEWRGPVWDDGFDSARVTFDLPAGPTEPRAEEGTGAPDTGAGARAPLVLSSLRRGSARDQLELLRPYAPKGEAITWTVRADARAFRAPAPPPAPKGVRAAFDALGGRGGAAHQGGLVAGALAIFILYSLLVARKAAETSRAAREHGTTARPLIPIPAAMRAVLAGSLLVAGLFVELVMARATAGALLVAGAVALAAHRTPLWPRATLRRPGRWLPITEAAAFADPPRPRGAWLDVSTLEGKLLLALSLGGVGALAAWMFETSPYRAELVAFDAVALLAVFCTGRLAELPPDPATAPARLLRDVAKRVRKALPRDEVRVIGRTRVPDGASKGDDLRLAVVPRHAPAGFGAIEVGVVHVRGAGGSLALPEVILRVKHGSACEAMAEGIARSGRSVRGRAVGEQAITFSPRLPTARMTAGIVTGIVRALCPARGERTRSAGGSSTSRTTRRAA
jgi:hypothetical protein